ncbi:hypothetical protein [Aliiroseovarius sp. YM-037]|uniref:hypothetical protein n=1 Tax=Aliiroseovarius sp. YM-037 TaxID=3341728 RepID=UPI003A804ACD
MTTPVFALRYDVSPAIGLGHLRRAFALSEELHHRGIRHLHAVTPEGANVLEAEGFSTPDTIVVDGQRADWINANSSITHVLTDICRAGNGEAAAQEIGNLSKSPAVVGVIDSMPPDHYAGTDTPSPDLLFTPYLNADRFHSTPNAANWRHGPKYAVISREYAAIDSGNGWTAGRVLVTCGGADPDELSVKIAQQLAQADIPADIVVGPLFSATIRDDLTTLAAENPNWALHHAPKSLAHLIGGAAFVVGRLGLTRYEAAALGRSGLYLSAGTAYRAYLEGFEAAGLARIFFDGDTNGTERFLAEIAALKDPATRKSLFRPNRAAMQVVDGNGAANMIEEMLNQDRNAR